VIATDPRPPRLARGLLRLRPLGTRRAEIEADLHEVFVERMARHGARHAGFRYYVDVLSVWRWNPSGVRLLRDMVQDLSHGIRVFRRNPAAVLVTIVGLSLSIAVSTSVFSLLNAVAFRPVGVADPESVVRVLRAQQNGISNGWSYGEYLAVRDRSRLTALEAVFGDSARFSATPPADDDQQSVSMTFVGGGYLATFGARPAYGRILAPADDAIGAPPVAVVSHGFWTRRLGADPTIVGRLVWLNGVPVTVVGVAPRSFTGITDNPPAFWAPFASYHVLYSGSPLTGTSRAIVNVLGRISKGATLAQAEAELGSAAVALGWEHEEYATTGVRLESARSRFGRASEARLVALVVTIVLTVVGLVVLLACVNVANLQLASAIARQREIGVRLALGATRARLVRQLVTESVALGLAAGVIGLLVTVWLLPALALAVRIPVTVDASPDVSIYLFLAVVSLGAGIGAGLAPARHGTRGDLMTPLKGDGMRVGASGRPGRTRATLIGVQAAVSLVLLVLAGLLTRAMVRATQVDVGFDARQLVSIAPAFARERYDAARIQAYWDAALTRVRALPNVRAASVARYLPYGDGQGVTIFPRNGIRYTTYVNETRADYFSTLGLRVVRGRVYTAAEVASGAPVVVISETLAKDFWPGEDPVGSSFARFEQSSNSTVIGVVSDAIIARLRELGAAAIYRPMTKAQGGRILIRTSAAPEAIVPAIRDALQPIDPRVRLDINLVSTGLQKELDEPRILASLAGALAALALGLAVVGIYGVTSFVAGHRTREIGVRIAVGASTRDVMRLLLGDSLRPVSIGLAAGLVLALPASRLFAGILYGVKAQDPLAFTAAVFVLFVSAAAAVYVPTRRAARVDPVLVLRQS
jgi:predicted permease